MQSVLPAQIHHFHPEVARMTIAAFPPHARTDKEHVNRVVAKKIGVPNFQKKHGLTWDETVEVVGANDLSRFHRHPDQLVAYKSHLSNVEASYGSVQRYVLDQLLEWQDNEDWQPYQAESSATGAKGYLPKRRPADVIPWSGCHHVNGDGCDREVYFEGRDGEYKVLTTPYPYAIPSDASHLIVWCRAPILHPCAIDNQTFPNHIRRLAWRHVQKRGLSGLVNCSMRDDQIPLKATYTGDLLDEVQVQLESRMEESQVRKAIWNAGRFVRRFVERTWGMTHEAVWFANPPSLQSVPDLAHFHCMIRPKAL